MIKYRQISQEEAFIIYGDSEVEFWPFKMLSICGKQAIVDLLRDQLNAWGVGSEGYWEAYAEVTLNADPMDLEVTLLLDARYTRDGKPHGISLKPKHYDWYIEYHAESDTQL